MSTDPLIAELLYHAQTPCEACQGSECDVAVHAADEIKRLQGHIAGLFTVIDKMSDTYVASGYIHGIRLTAEEVAPYVAICDAAREAIK